MRSTYKYPIELDHIVFTARTLDEGMDAIERILGVRPVRGGQHPQWGTHNALIALGDRIYLEVISPDPSLPQPEKGFLPKEIFDGYPKMATWVLRSSRIDKIHHSLTSKGLKIGDISQGNRMKPDESLLTWKLTDPSAFPCNGMVPFIIDWGDSVHPADGLPRGGELLDFKLKHPHPEKIRQFTDLMECDVQIIKENHISFIATVETSLGKVSFR